MPFLLFISLFLEIGFNVNPNPENKEKLYTVSKVTDGDTFIIKDGSNVIKVRLIGIDAPESHPSKYKQIGFYGAESKIYLSNLIFNKKVKLIYDIGRKDKYGRTLAYVYLTNGVFVNAQLILQGYAKVLTVPPNVKYASLFVSLQKKARSSKKGLWMEK